MNPVHNEPMIYGYARVSTDGQSVDAQVKQLRAAGAEKVFRETASGAKSDRAQLRLVLAKLDKGDVLMVTRLDRLARSTHDLLNTVAAIAAKKAGFKSLADTWADSTTPHGRLMLAVLGGLSEFESSLIHARTGEGRERAKARGVKMGPKFKLTPHQQREAIRRRDIKGEPVREIARTYNVSHSTISEGDGSTWPSDGPYGQATRPSPPHGRRRGKPGGGRPLVRHRFRGTEEAAAEG
jgi:DNA invertase Pin-like site-specific DNA recombinase